MNTLDVDLVEAVSARVHAAWMDTKRAQGVTSRPSEWSEEQMVPYAELSERAKDLDRGTVRAVLSALSEVQDAQSQIGWQCSACGWATVDHAEIAKALWIHRDGDDKVVDMICPNCQAEGLFVDYEEKR